MIILDAPLPKKRPRSRRQSDEITEDSQFGPPSYHSDVARFPLQPLLDSAPLPSLRRGQVPNNTLRRRFRGWLFYLLAVYAVLSISIAVPYIIIHHRAGDEPIPYRRMRPPGLAENSSDIPVVPVNVPRADGSVLGCNLWDYSYDYGSPNNLRYSKLTYCLPHNATNIWVHALGGHDRLVSGRFTVKLNPDEDEQDYMVDVMLTYPSDDDDARNSSAICLMRETDTWGVGIYTPPQAVNHSLHYQLTFLVPQGAGPLELSRFTTYLPWFSYIFEDLNDTLNFGDIQVGGVASPVHATISGQTVNVTTSRGAITGSYRASDSLILQTSKARIDTNITLGSIVGQNSPTKLFMKSSEGSFSAMVNISTSGSNDDGSLDSSNSTTNLHMRPQYSTRISCEDSPVNLVFRPDDTAGSFDLDVEVNTTLNRAIVLLDSDMEGTFDLHSRNGTVIVSNAEGGELRGPDSLSGPFPFSNSVETLQPASQARGALKRAGETQGQRVNVHVQNRLALVALGFFKRGEVAPGIADLPLP